MAALEAEVSPEGYDYFEDALTAIFDVVQPAEGVRGQELHFRDDVVGEISFLVPDVMASNSNLNAQYQWASGRILSKLLTGSLKGVAAYESVRKAVSPMGKSVIELGAGTGLPSMVTAKLGASIVSQKTR